MGDVIRRAVSDPGSVVPRLGGFGVDGDELESLPAWQARAVRHVITGVLDVAKIEWLIHTLDLIDNLAVSRGMDTSCEAQDDLRKLADMLNGDTDGQ